MNLPESKLQVKYRDEIRPLEASILDAADGGAPKEQYINLQARLDQLAQRYQHKEELGDIRYKLYELQALLYYAQNRDADAKAFIEAAIETRGSSYRRADQLLDRLKSSEESAASNDNLPGEEIEELSKEERRKRQIGLEGWLALFVVGVVIGIVLNLISLAGYPSAFSDLSSTSETFPNAVSDFAPLLWLEVIVHFVLIGTGIYLLILMNRHKALAKTVAIIFMVGTIFFGFIDYAWGSSLYERYNLGTSEIDKQAMELGRSVLYAAIWIPYFLIAKRVKVTLTK